MAAGYASRRIGANIRAAVKRGGMSEAQASRELGLHHQTVSKWCRGEADLTAVHLAELCSLLGCSADEILELR